jgi:chromosome segregation ATPase
MYLHFLRFLIVQSDLAYDLTNVPTDTTAATELILATLEISVTRLLSHQAGIQKQVESMDNLLLHSQKEVRVSNALLEASKHTYEETSLRSQQQVTELKRKQKHTLIELKKLRAKYSELLSSTVHATIDKQLVAEATAESSVVRTAVHSGGAVGPQVEYLERALMAAEDSLEYSRIDVHAYMDARVFNFFQDNTNSRSGIVTEKQVSSVSSSVVREAVNFSQFLCEQVRHLQHIVIPAYTKQVRTLTQGNAELQSQVEQMTQVNKRQEDQIKSLTQVSGRLQARIPAEAPPPMEILTHTVTGREAGAEAQATGQVVKSVTESARDDSSMRSCKESSVFSFPDSCFISSKDEKFMVTPVAGTSGSVEVQTERNCSDANSQTDASIVQSPESSIMPPLVDAMTPTGQSVVDAVPDKVSETDGESTNSYEQTCAVKDAHQLIRQLQVQVSKLTGARATLQSEVKTLTERSVQLQAENNYLDAQLDEAAEELNSLSHAHEQTEQALSEEVAAAKNKLERALEQLQSVTASLSRTEAQTLVQKQEHDDARTHLLSQIQSLQSDTQKQQVFVKALTQEKAQQRTQIAQLQGEVTTKQTHVETLNAEIDSLQTRVRTLQGSIIDQETKVAASQLELEVKDKQLTCLRADLEQAVAHITSLEKGNADQELHIQTLSREHQHTQALMHTFTHSVEYHLRGGGAKPVPSEAEEDVSDSQTHHENSAFLKELRLTFAQRTQAVSDIITETQQPRTPSAQSNELSKQIHFLKEAYTPKSPGPARVFTFDEEDVSTNLKTHANTIGNSLTTPTRPLSLTPQSSFYVSPTRTQISYGAETPKQSATNTITSQAQIDKLVSDYESKLHLYMIATEEQTRIIDTLRQTLVQAQDRHTCTELELVNTQLKLTDTQSYIDTMRADHTCTQRALKRTHSQHAVAQDERSQVQQQLNEAQTELNNTQGVLALVQRELAIYKRTDESTEPATSIHLQVETLTHELAVTQALVADSQLAYSTGVGLLNAREVELTHVRLELEQCKAAHADSESNAKCQIEALTVEHTRAMENGHVQTEALKANLSATQAELNEARILIETLEDTQRRSQEALQSVRCELNTRTLEHADCQGELILAESLVHSVKLELSDTLKCYAGLCAELEELPTQSASAAQSMGLMRDEYSQRREQFRLLETEHESNVQLLSDTQQRLDLLRMNQLLPNSSADEVKDTVSGVVQSSSSEFDGVTEMLVVTLQHELEQTQEMLETHTTKLTYARTELVNTQKQVEQLKFSLVHARQELGDAQASNDRMRLENERLRMGLAGLESKLFSQAPSYPSNLSAGSQKGGELPVSEADTSKSPIASATESETLSTMLKEELSVTNKILQTSYSEQADLRNRLAQAAMELSGVRHQNVSLCQDLESLRNEIGSTDRIATPKYSVSDVTGCNVGIDEPPIQQQSGLLVKQLGQQLVDTHEALMQTVTGYAQAQYQLLHCRASSDAQAQKLHICSSETAFANAILDQHTREHAHRKHTNKQLSVHLQNAQDMNHRLTRTNTQLQQANIAHMHTNKQLQQANHLQKQGNALQGEVIDALEQELSNTKNELEDMLMFKDALAEELDDTKAHWTSVSNRVQEMEAEAQISHEHVTHRESQLELAHIRIHDLVSEMVDLHAQVSTGEAQSRYGNPQDTRMPASAVSCTAAEIEGASEPRATGESAPKKKLVRKRSNHRHSFNTRTLRSETDDNITDKNLLSDAPGSARADEDMSESEIQIVDSSVLSASDMEATAPGTPANVPDKSIGDDAEDFDAQAISISVAPLLLGRDTDSRIIGQGRTPHSQIMDILMETQNEVRTLTMTNEDLQARIRHLTETHTQFEVVLAASKEEMMCLQAFIREGFASFNTSQEESQTDTETLAGMCANTFNEWDGIMDGLVTHMHTYTKELADLQGMYLAQETSRPNSSESPSGTPTFSDAHSNNGEDQLETFFDSFASTDNGSS